MNKTLILVLIVFSQFFGTSLWFSTNAILSSLARVHQLDSQNLLANLTIATQLGFIVGSLLYAFLGLADRFFANIVFSISIVLAALANASILIPNLNFPLVFLFRLLTGFFLAGVYPVGMKIAAYFFPKSVSSALGVLVGALVLGTSFSHFTMSFDIKLTWEAVIYSSSGLAVLGGILILFLKTPPKENIQTMKINTLPLLFKKKKFKTATFAYYGHMWELYTFWAFIPLLITTYKANQDSLLNSNLLTFMIISIGALGCVLVGKIAVKKDLAKITKIALMTSGICCLLCPLSFYFPTYIFVPYLMIWGISFVADSPLLSTLINDTCDPNHNGTGLTISTSIGFFTTIISLYLFNILLNTMPIQYVFTCLALGPFLSVYFLSHNNSDPIV